jgi:predicted aspartyl protease
VYSATQAGNPQTPSSTTALHFLQSQASIKMESVTSRSTLAAIQGIHLIATCLLNAPTTQMTVCEIFEWLSRQYPRYHYTKKRIRYLLEYYSKKGNPNPVFVIANKYRVAGEQHHWTISSGIEPQLRRWLGDTLPPKAELCEARTASQYCGIDHQEASIPTHQSQSTFRPSPIWNDLQDQEFKENEELHKLQRLQASRQTNTQESIKRVFAPISGTRRDCIRDSKPLQSTTKAVDRNRAVQNPDASRREHKRLRGRSSRESTVDSRIPYKFYTKGAILSTKGIVELQRVLIDGSSAYNLLPQSLASELALPMHFGDRLRIKLASRSISTNQYCRFNIQVAGVERAINTCVVAELSSLLLGREWIRQVDWIRVCGDDAYYILRDVGTLEEVVDLGTAAAAKAEKELPTEEEIAVEDTGEEATMGEYLPMDSSNPSKVTNSPRSQSSASAAVDTLSTIGVASPVTTPSQFSTFSSSVEDELTSNDEFWEDAVSFQT